ncbi:ABC-type transport system, permease component [Alteracholeplasma palmae J233]|uniref:ABC-type transport system, permease component n=1 Tax=Alteracholeplasma palmae (strain ATCC 49389 / J233) TaxID=1318466 RepID=U4KR01_ALTPJ|nr:PstA family ABC transporter permease [Alteracholeplasma palmae]CCV63746.1 ABC-type transport system, permease component [Alteracholeplasma palmae J233]
MKNRKLYDYFGKTLVYGASLISVVVLTLILYFVFSNGLPLLNFKIITGDNEDVITSLKTEKLDKDLLKDIDYEGVGSKRYGIAFKEENGILRVTYISKESPLKNVNIGDYLIEGNYELINDKKEMIQYSLDMGIEAFIAILDKTVEIKSLPVNILGQNSVVKTNSIFKTFDIESKGFVSKRYGVSLIDGKNLEGSNIILVEKIHPDSPFKTTSLYDSDTKSPIEEGDAFYNAGILMWDNEGNLIRFSIKDGAEKMAQALDKTVDITMLPVVLTGGGIRGSIITTLYLIGLTLMIALPIGVFTAVYLHEMAPQNKITELLRSFVDMLTGVPSIIYGLMGAALFIPLSQNIFGSNVIKGASLISGSLTLAVIVLPVIIKSTESSLDVVPKDFKLASLALGANETQTTFKVMLPNAIPGILSAALLSIGRIMGESAALIYAIGTVVKDEVSVFGNGTSLAVHIWSAMQGESPNFALASTISIIILIVVLSLNLLVKLITFRLTKKYH